jgi:hypothetical protein
MYELVAALVLVIALLALAAGATYVVYRLYQRSR